MVFERNFSRFAILSEEKIITALNKISGNKLGFVIALSERGELQGILTDGDIRRWLSTTSEIDLEAPVSSTINPQFLSLPESTPPQEIDAHFSDRIKAIPLTDTRGRLVGIALPGLPELVIGDRLIGENQPSFLIAEIGNNHNGDVDLGRRLVDLAAEAGADCAKFQMRDISALYGDAANKEADAQDLGAQYTMDLLSRFNLGQNDLYTLFDHCRDHGMEPMCTPWDLPSLKALETYGMAAYKVASADLTNHELLAAMAATGKPLICSTGMSRESEIREGAAIMRRAGAPFALLHCNSTYPAPYKDINLGYMKRLAELEGCPVGYSGHERGWAVPIAAVSLGASIVEKHFTVDRSMEGNDHRVSLLPDEFSEMVKAIRNVEQAMLGNADQRELTQGEMMNREVLAKSVYATVDVPEG
ncbi:MAG: N-acetylneuraminate synthase family protein, partial [Roseibium sp.]|uniref:N-acetylneuraminate synthase family protein n=1 Tax=Roseibium sp. TaxID=1936156 RepID=UPI003266FEA1